MSHFSTKIAYLTDGTFVQVFSQIQLNVSCLFTGLLSFVDLNSKTTHTDTLFGYSYSVVVVGGGDDIVTHGMLRPKRMMRTNNLHSSAIKTLRMRTNPKTFVQQIITTTNLIQSVHDILQGAGFRNSLIHSATR